MLQHEVDHLNGVLFVDRTDRVFRESREDEMAALEAAVETGDDERDGGATFVSGTGPWGLASVEADHESQS